MRSPFEKKARSSGPSNREVQNIRRRANQGPGIHKADERAHSTLPKDGSEELTGYPLLPDVAPTDPRHPARKGETDAARQRADEAHSRFTNVALDTAHNRADAAHSRTTNTAVDAAHGAAESANTNANSAHGNANGRLSRADGGTVTGLSRFTRFQEQYTLANASVGANSTVTYTVGSIQKHITMAQVYDDTNGWIMLPTIGSTPVFIFTNTSTHFAIRNTRSTSETVRARLWEDA